MCRCGHPKIRVVFRAVHKHDHIRTRSQPASFSTIVLFSLPVAHIPGQLKQRPRRSFPLPVVFFPSFLHFTLSIPSLDELGSPQSNLNASGTVIQVRNPGYYAVDSHYESFLSPSHSSSSTFYGLSVDAASEKGTGTQLRETPLSYHDSFPFRGTEYTKPTHAIENCFSHAKHSAFCLLLDTHSPVLVL